MAGNTAGKHTMRLSEIMQETPAIRIYRFVPVSGPLFEYQAGQFVIANIPDPAHPGKILRRSYSIASTPLKRDYLELCIKLSETGTTGPLWKNLKQDAELVIEGPYGRFILETQANKKLFLVGSGSGIAPLMCMLRTLVKEHAKNPVTLIYGFHHDDDFAYRKEILSYVSDNIRIKPVASTPDDGWGYATGHVQDVINTLAAPDFSESLWYLCGPPAMVKDVAELLMKKAVPLENIKREIFE